MKNPVLTDGILLPGWDCPNSECGAFNGTAKEDLKICRCCGTSRPSDLDLAFKRLQKTHEQALANLTSVQERCTSLVMENRELRDRLSAADAFKNQRDKVAAKYENVLKTASSQAQTTEKK